MRCSNDQVTQIEIPGVPLGLFAGSTYAAIKNEFECKAMPDHALRGKEKPLKLYEVISASTAAVVAV